MYTLLDSCLDRIDIFEFLSHVEDGLKDHYDVKMLTYLMVVRLANLSPGPVLQRKFIYESLPWVVDSISLKRIKLFHTLKKWD